MSVEDSPFCQRAHLRRDSPENGKENVQLIPECVGGGMDGRMGCIPDLEFRPFQTKSSQREGGLWVWVCIGFYTEDGADPMAMCPFLFKP